jgi:hypothetical protein
MRYAIALGAIGLMVGATTAHGIDLTGGKAAKFVNKPGLVKDKAQVKFAKDLAIAAPLPAPVCPGTSEFRLRTNRHDSGPVALDCLFWSASGQTGFKYKDKGLSAFGLKNGKIKPGNKGGQLALKWQGFNYGGIAIDGPVDYVEARLTINGTEFCGRFEAPPSTIKKNELEKVDFRGPSIACDPLPTPTATATPTDTPLPTDTPTASATPTVTDTATATATATDTTTPGPTFTDTATPLPTEIPDAFRANQLAIRDPHIFIDIGACVDITDPNFLGISINELIADAIELDDGGDGFLDLSVLSVFRPLLQPPLSGGAAEIYTGECTVPLFSEVCSSGGNPPGDTTYTNQAAGTCVAPVAGTTGPNNSGGYVPSVVSPAAPCYSSAPIDTTFTLGGIDIALEEVVQGATYVGVPASDLANGLISGFLSEADADAILLPADLPIVGGAPLSSVLPGGTGSCAPSDDRDLGPGGELGWYFYLNYSAHHVTWVDP